MADFNEAMQWVRDGKEVRRAEWPIGKWIRLEYDNRLRFAENDQDGEFYVVNMGDMSADDWECCGDIVPRSDMVVPVDQLMKALADQEIHAELMDKQLVPAEDDNGWTQRLTLNIRGPREGQGEPWVTSVVPVLEWKEQPEEKDAA